MAVIALTIARASELPNRPALPRNIENVSSKQEKSRHSQRIAPHLEYRSPRYGFCFVLPEDWRGYSVVVMIWQGVRDDAPANEKPQQGPIIMIRHPRWTSMEPRQDIPIMVFTQDQWRDLQSEKFVVSAAPFPPTELGRNHKYVFGLPPRYNYAFPPGYEEVEQILRGNPLKGECLTDEGHNRQE